MIRFTPSNHLNRILCLATVAFFASSAQADSDINLAGAHTADQKFSCSSNTRIHLNGVAFSGDRCR